MKVRIGIAIGPAPQPRETIAEIADAIDECGFDSLWLPELLTMPVPDPMVALAWAAGRSTTLKIGTTALLPGRNVLRLAKQAATLDALSDGRLLLTLVPGIARGPERAAVGSPARRGDVIDEVLPVLRRLWAGETVTYHGVAGGDLEDIALSPLPVQDPLEVWLGGKTPEALARCGRLADGWLPALCTPDELAAGRAVLEEVAASAGRPISPEHYGASIGYAREALPEGAVRDVEARGSGRRAEELVPVGLDALREHLERFVEAGGSKFVVRPVVPPESWKQELTELAAAVGDLQS